MIAAAEEKVRVEQNRKDAQDVLTRTLETLKQFDTRATEIRKALETAENETKQALAKIREASKERQQERAKELQPQKPAPTAKTSADKGVSNKSSEDPLEIRAATATAPPVASVKKESILTLTFKDGRKLRVSTLLEDPDGRVAVKDEQGKVQYFDAAEIVKRESTEK